MSKTKSTKRYACPICGTTYPSERLALHCVRPMCQEINRVPKAMAYEWRVQALPAAMIHMLAEVFDGSGNAAAQAMADRLHKHLAKVYAQLQAKLPVPRSYSLRHRQGLSALIDGVWGWRTEQHSAHVIETAWSLIEDVRDHLAEQGRMDERIPWNWLALAMAAALKLVDPEEERPGCEQTDDAYKALRQYIWQESDAKGRSLRMWLVGGRFYVAAHDRREAEQIVLRETGIVGLRAKGMPLDANVWDELDNPAGRVRDMLPANGRPCFVGRAA